MDNEPLVPLPEGRVVGEINKVGALVAARKVSDDLWEENAELRAIITRLTAERDEAVALLRDLRTFFRPCVCDEAYTGRGLDDPSCEYHEMKDEVDATDAFLATLSSKEQSHAE